MYNEGISPTIFEGCNIMGKAYTVVGTVFLIGQPLEKVETNVRCITT